jgi:TIR domain-containing protein
MSLFVSYSHKQSEWVHSRLIPVLSAAGGKVLVDIDHFKAGQTVIGQMDALQSSASCHVLVIIADYVASPYCRHEM